MSVHPVGKLSHLPYSDGYDFQEINTDDFLALCREIRTKGRSPFAWARVRRKRRRPGWSTAMARRILVGASSAPSVGIPNLTG